jgi:hypothetical protein
MDGIEPLLAKGQQAAPGGTNCKNRNEELGKQVIGLPLLSKMGRKEAHRRKYTTLKETRGGQEPTPETDGNLGDANLHADLEVVFVEAGVGLLKFAETP